jgi:hypothetical protein
MFFKMDFLFHVPFFCTAAAAVAEILTRRASRLFVNIEFHERKKLNHFVQISISSRVPKLPESTRRKQAIFNTLKGLTVL